MIKVSVIVPVYNVEKYLEECLDSILNQTLKELEVICVDDGSTDSSGEILDRYAARDIRVKVIHKDNEGYGRTMNRGLEMACGKYIGIVESDDFIEPEMYEDLYALATAFDLDFVKGDHWYYTEKEGKILNPGLTKYCECNKLFSRYENMNKIIAPKAIWSGIYKRNFLNQYAIRFAETQGASYQDTSFWHKVAMAAERGYFTDKPYHNYRRDNINASVKSKGKVYCLCHELQESKNFMEKNNFDKSIIYPYLVADKTLVYLWNLNRIADEWKQEFLLHMAKELKEDMSGGYLDSKVMGEWNYNTVISIMQYPQSYFYMNYLQDKKYNLTNLDSINENLKEKTSVYIYGAGKVGTSMKEYLKTTVGVPATFLVSEKEASDSGVEWIESNRINTNLTVIISIRGLMNRYEMCQRAINRGFQNIYILEDDLISLIRK